LARPFPFELKAVGFVELARQDNHHPDHVLGNRDAVQAAGVDDEDVALDHFRKEHMRRPRR
jgi:phage protein U